MQGDLDSPAAPVLVAHAVASCLTPYFCYSYVPRAHAHSLLLQQLHPCSSVPTRFLCSVPREEKAAERVARPVKSVDILEVMQRVKAAALKDRVRIEEFMRDSDPLRKGFVTAHQLEAALSAASLR